jgi:hypothetical protein
MGSIFPATGTLMQLDMKTNSMTKIFPELPMYLYGLEHTCGKGMCSNGQSIISQYCPYVGVGVTGSVEANPEIVCVGGNKGVVHVGALGVKYNLVTSGPWAHHFWELGSYYVLAHSYTDSAVFAATFNFDGSSVSSTLKSYVLSEPQALWGKTFVNPIVSILWSADKLHPETVSRKT